MKSTIKYLVLIIMCWVCGENLQAQPYMFRNVVMSDGLSGLLVNAIYKDSEGFIWLGTDNGLDRFDGVKVKHFEFRGVDSGRKKRVNCITETDNKQLWIGNGIGLWRLNRSGPQTSTFRSNVSACPFSSKAMTTTAAPNCLMRAA